VNDATAFREGHVEAGGLRLRYAEAGRGPALVHIPAAGPLRLTPAHDLLARRFRVVVFEIDQATERAATLAQAFRGLRLDTFNLMGTASGSQAALSLALQAPERVAAVVLEAPAAIRREARDADLDRRLPALATPTLVLAGTRDAPAQVAAARSYRALLPQSHLVLVYDAGPDVAADRPEAFAEVVGDFLEHGETFVISRAATVIHP
jgi:pimeloyl-ACP methyl ester carboxylesterase